MHANENLQAPSLDRHRPVSLPPALPAGVVRGAHLGAGPDTAEQAHQADQSDLAGDSDQPDRRAFIGAEPSANDVLLDGSLRHHTPQPGLLVHCSQVRDRRDLLTRARVGPGLKIVILLAGESDVSVGGRPLFLAVDPARRRARGLMLVTTEACVYERRWQRGRFERKVVVHLTTDWLRDLGFLQPQQPPVLAQFLQTHLAVHHWEPSAHAVALAEQLAIAPETLTVVDALRLASRATELACEAVAGMLGAHDASGEPVASTRLTPRGQQRLLQVRDRLASRQTDALSVATIAREHGIAISTLQRQFRALFGCTMEDFRRDVRLERARQALEERGVSVAEAALAAGYNSPANFATAFRRRFGLSPSGVRARV